MKSNDDYNYKYIFLTGFLKEEGKGSSKHCNFIFSAALAVRSYICVYIFYD